MIHLTKRKLSAILAPVAVLVLIPVLILSIVSIYVYNNHFCIKEIGPGMPATYYRLENHEISTWRYFDNNGIVMWDYGGSLGKQYNPVVSSQYALANYNCYLVTRDEEYRDEFLRHANWLVKRQTITHNGIGVWYYEFDWSSCRCKAPWISSMAQGQAISVLIRAYALTGQRDYLQAAKSAVEAFEYSAQEGGVCVTDDSGNVFYLEYVCKSNAYVLNGFIFSLVGLYDYYKYTDEAQGLELFARGIKTLKARLQDYDTGSWTYYSLRGDIATMQYHKLHCRQAYELYFITGDPFFLDYAQRWELYLEKRRTPYNIAIETRLLIWKKLNGY